MQLQKPLQLTFRVDAIDENRDESRVCLESEERLPRKGNLLGLPGTCVGRLYLYVSHEDADRWRRLKREGGKVCCTFNIEGGEGT